MTLATREKMEETVVAGREELDGQRRFFPTDKAI
jgi:hypothetical protein